VTASQLPSPATAPRRGRRKAKPSCAECYFGNRMLCALERDEPCTTFRPDLPEGLVPPTQPTLLVRSDSPPRAELATSADAALAA
jgi:hypothetical protein